MTPVSSCWGGVNERGRFFSFEKRHTFSLRARERERESERERGDLWSFFILDATARAHKASRVCVRSLSLSLSSPFADGRQGPRPPCHRRRRRGRQTEDFLAKQGAVAQRPSRAPSRARRIWHLILRAQHPAEPRYLPLRARVHARHWQREETPDQVL